MYVNIEAAAEWLGVSRDTLERMAKAHGDGWLWSRRMVIGGSVVFDRTDLAVYAHLLTNVYAPRPQQAKGESRAVEKNSEET